jgi:hypothetical protein
MGVLLMLTDHGSQVAFVRGRARVQIEPGRACLESIAGDSLVDFASMRAELLAEKATLQLTCSRAAAPP